MKKKKIVAGTIFVLIMLSVATLIIYNIISGRFRYNEEDTVGNTTGNLYNEGLFCEYKGYVYFANPADDNSLYIQIANDYIYYIRFNKTAADVVLRGHPYGIYRLEIGDNSAECVYNGLVKSMRMLGNYIYFQAYDDENLIQFKKVKVDGEELKVISDTDYLPMAVFGTDIYFPGVDDNHNLRRFETDTERMVTVYEGNYYMPAFTSGFMYYIDLDNDMKLTRISLRNNETEVLDEGRCINYNISEDQEVIYYQLENDDDHKLCRMRLNGLDKVTVTEGDCCNIHITENYTYFYKLAGVERGKLYRVKNDDYVVQEVILETED